MLKKFIKLFCLFLLTGLCEAYSVYLDRIRDDYCLDYCANECKDDDTIENAKTCTTNGNTLITDKYNIEVKDRDFTIIWKINPVNLTDLKKLNSSDYKFIVYELQIKYLKDDFFGRFSENAIVRAVDYMKALNLYTLEKFSDGTSTSYISEQSVNVNDGAHIIHFNHLNDHSKLSDFYSKYFAGRRDRLIHITFNGTEVFDLNDKIIQNNIKRLSISLYNLNLENLSRNFFENCFNITNLYISNSTSKNFEFFRSIKLQNNLEILHLLSRENVDFSVFEYYKKLKKIYVTKEDLSYYSQIASSTNLTAFICDYPSDQGCVLNVGINGKRCPSGCQCLRQKIWDPLVIDCNRCGLSNIPELPIPIEGHTILKFENNGLTHLPNLTNEGYNNLKELHLANNNLTNLTMNQLPRSLSVLDIRENKLTALDDDVAKFVREMFSRVQLSGNPWQCSCRYTKFLDFLRVQHLSVYKAAIKNCSGRANCPFRCSCCVDENQKFTKTCKRGFPLIFVIE